MRIGLLIVACLISTQVSARTVLQNDSVVAGAEIAFYPNMRGGESFVSIFDVPAEYENYQVCRILLWIGPAGFNIFTFRLAEADENGNEAQLIWQSDLDAYQVFGSREQLSSVDLAALGIRTNVRRLRIRGRHVDGQGAPPGIASDTDGITPGRNRLRMLMRNGGWFSDFTEILEENGTPQRPPGDWIFRLEIAHLNEACPNGEAVLPDMSMPPPVRDAAVPMDAQTQDMDAGVLSPDASVDAGVDASSITDTRPPVPDSEFVDDAQTMRADRAFDALEALELTRISPSVGPRDRNTEVVINGRGFPVDEPPFIELDSTRLLEVDVLSGSTITAVVPAGLDEGLHDLRLTRYDGQVALLPNAFEVLGAALQITAVSPREVAQYTPADISIQGRGFTPETNFSIGGIGLQSVTIESTEVARGTLSASLPPGTYDLVATNETDNARLLDAITVLDKAGERGADGGGCVQRQTDHQNPLYGLLLVATLMMVRRRR